MSEHEPWKPERPWYYILGGEDGRTPIPVDNVLEWARWFESTAIVDPTTQMSPRHVAHTVIPELDCHISTVFLALNHNFSADDNAPPILFETMIFGGPTDDYMRRYATWDDAAAGHARVVARLMAVRDARVRNAAKKQQGP